MSHVCRFCSFFSQLLRKITSHFSSKIPKMICRHSMASLRFFKKLVLIFFAFFSTRFFPVLIDPAAPSFRKTGELRLGIFEKLRITSATFAPASVISEASAASDLFTTRESSFPFLLTRSDMYGVRTFYLRPTCSSSAN